MGKQSNRAIDVKPPKNRFLTIFYLYLFQGVFFGSVALLVYGIFTLNFNALLFLIFITIIQMVVRRSEAYIKFVNSHIKPLHYFKGFCRIYDQQIPDEEYSLFCFHPHSVFIYGILANANADSSKMSSLVPLSSRFMLNFPGVGFILKMWGVQSVDKSNMLRLMREKKDIGLVPGGFEQATITTPHEFRVFIKNRKGFIKYALQNGYTIRPVLIYNEHKAYKTLDKFKKIRLMFNKLKMPGVFFWGGDFGLFLKTDWEMVTIVGKGLKRSRQSGEICPEEIDRVHEEYIKEVERVHGKYREQFGQAPLVLY